jgi:hypothetical protein
MTAFADHLDLRTAVLEMVGRTDIVDVFPRLLKLAEAYLNRQLRLRDQIASANLTVATRIAPLPADFLEVIALYDSTQVELIAQPLHALEDVCPARTFYAIDGANIRATDGEVKLDYYARIPTIADAITDSNWLLQKYPSVYLYAVGLEAVKYIRDIEAIPGMKRMVEDELGEAFADDERARYSGARVRVGGVTP